VYCKDETIKNQKRFKNQKKFNQSIIMVWAKNHWKYVSYVKLMEMYLIQD